MSEGEGEGEGEPLPPSSCLEILARDPSATSGAFDIVVDGVGRVVACDMATEGGGWTLLLRYREGDACPPGWAAAARGCVRPASGGASQASTTVLPSHPFAAMRGIVAGFGLGGSDAYRDGTGATIDGIYVDGLTITRGVPRRHVFTFAHGCTEVFGDGATCGCPCDGGTAAPTFVGTDFRCEEPQRSVEPSNTGNRFFDVDDPLFDGGGIEDATCVGDAESSSSFTIEMADVAADPVELRLMGTEGSGNEDLAVVGLELWIR